MGTGAEAKDHAAQRAPGGSQVSGGPRTLRGGPGPGPPAAWGPMRPAHPRGSGRGDDGAPGPARGQHSPQVPRHHFPPGGRAVPRVHLGAAPCAQPPPRSPGREPEPPRGRPARPPPPRGGPVGCRPGAGLGVPAAGGVTPAPRLCWRSQSPTPGASCARFYFPVYSIHLWMCVRAPRDEIK